MKKKSENTVDVFPRRDNLKRQLRKHLKSIGLKHGKDGSLEAEAGSGKDVIRALHLAQRNDRLLASREFIDTNIQKLIEHFAEGTDVEPVLISPKLERIFAGTWQSNLFRLASLTWAVPVSNGFGRRLRYLVWDDHNKKLIGIIAIGDPVFNLSARDKLIDWTSQDRVDRLVNIMDAYVLGAVPPYNMLLGGKLVAALVRSREIYDDFAEAYGDTKGIISGKRKKARLLAVTTSSSLGRSSIYNRLKLGGAAYFRPIGYTGGWGHFHIPDNLFADLRAYLKEIGHPSANHRFGQGPNWRLRTTRAALAALGFREDMLRHGIRREVFLCELATNATLLLHKGTGRPKLASLLRARAVAALAVKRWLLPRSERRPEYRTWRKTDLIALLTEKRELRAPARRERRAARG